MSMTKRHLESLPSEQQDDILGVPGEWLEAEYETVPQTFCKPEDDYYCDHPFRIAGEECPNCGAPESVNIRFEL